MDKAQPVSDLLRTITDKEALWNHDISEYADAFEDSGVMATRVIGIGGDTVVLELANGDVLKMTNIKIFYGDFGNRPFDLPILERGFMPNPVGREISYFVQPFAQTPVSREDVLEFFDTARKYGYRFVDPSRRNLGTYLETIWLLDPWAVRR